MSSITSDTLRIIDRAGADPTFTEIFARLSYATNTEVRDTFDGLSVRDLLYLIIAHQCASLDIICLLKLKI